MFTKDSDVHVLPVTVESGRGQPCRASSYITLTSPSGVIANVETQDTGRGSVDCPWLITAPSGQRINITLYDFAVQPHRTSVCEAYAIIRENDQARNTITVCGETERVRHIYTSVSNSLQVRIMPGIGKEKSKYFLIKYEGTTGTQLNSCLNQWNYCSVLIRNIETSPVSHQWVINPISVLPLY